MHIFIGRSTNEENGREMQKKLSNKTHGTAFFEAKSSFRGWWFFFIESTWIKSWKVLQCYLKCWSLFCVCRRWITLSFWFCSCGDQCCPFYAYFVVSTWNSIAIIGAETKVWREKKHNVYAAHVMCACVYAYVRAYRLFSFILISLSISLVHS